MTMTSEEQCKAINTIRQSLSCCPNYQVLVVGDNDRDSELCLEIMKSRGLPVVWVKTAAAALDCLSQYHNWIVFLDLNLECAGAGLQLLQEMSQVCARCQTKCKTIVLAGFCRDDSVECKQALAAGAVAVMLKPVTSGQIELIFGNLK